MNPIIERIEVDMELLHSELKLKSDKQKHQIIRKYCGGTCTYCGEIPIKKVSYDVGDCDKLIEFYCDSCYLKHESELDKRLQNINLSK